MPSTIQNAVHILIHLALKITFWGGTLIVPCAERLVILLLIFSISSSNSTCWQKWYSELHLAISSLKSVLEFLVSLVFPGRFSSCWGLCSIITWRSHLIPCGHQLPYTSFCWDVQLHLVLSSDGWPSSPAFAEGVRFPSGFQPLSTYSHQG